MASNAVTVSFLAAAVAVAALVACGEPQVAKDAPAEAISATTPPPDAGDPAVADDAPVEATTTDVPSDAGPAPAPVEQTDVFTGAAPFGSVQSTVDSEGKHFGLKNTGRDCFSCHGNLPFAPQFIFAGTVPSTPNAEVRVVGPDGTELGLVATDPEGNFWLEGNTALPTGSKVGIRTATGKQLMAEPIAAGGCNQASCHDSNRPLTAAAQ